MKFFIPFFFLFLFWCIDSWGQFTEPSDKKYKISGKVTDAKTGLPLAGVMIINKRTNTGVFGEPDGNFSIYIIKDDQLIFSAVGYETKIFSLHDSIWKNYGEINIKLNKLNIDLQEVTVFPERSLKEIQKDIEDLGVNYAYQVQGTASFSSPITFLYERFSRFEKQKRKAAELYNEENKKELLKELFRKYIKADIINLSLKDFDEFISYCRLPEEFIKEATQYDLVMAIKLKYNEFKELGKR